MIQVTIGSSRVLPFAALPSGPNCSEERDDQESTTTVEGIAKSRERYHFNPAAPRRLYVMHISLTAANCSEVLHGSFIAVRLGAFIIFLCPFSPK